MLVDRIGIIFLVCYIGEYGSKNGDRAVKRKFLSAFYEVVRSKDVLIVGVLFLLAGLLYWPLINLQATYKFSAPVMPLLGTVGSWITPFNYDQVVNFWVFVLFCMFPVSVYFFVWRLIGWRLSGIVAALFAMMPIFSGGRAEATFLLGDAAHIVSLTFMPIGALALISFLRWGGFGRAAWASLSLALVALTSPFGLFVYLIFMGVVTFSEMLLSSGRLKFMRLVVVGLLGGLMSQFWYTFGYMRLIVTSTPGQEMVSTLSNLIPLSMFLAPVLGVIGFLLFEKRPQLQPVFIAGGLVVIFWLFSFAGRLSEGLYISHQGRYRPDLAMAIAFFAGVSVGIYDFLKTFVPITQRWKNKPAKAFLGILVVVGILGGWFSWGKVRQVVDDGGLVLGVFSEEIVGIGEIRNQTGWLDKLMGGVVSAGSVGGLAWANMRYGKSGELPEKKSEKDNKPKG